MDWEVQIPSIYKSANVNTLDLFHWLESINNGNMELIGCVACLKNKGKTICKGVVESISNVGKLTTISISDWLGNPSIINADAFASIGAIAGGPMLPVAMSEKNHAITFAFPIPILGTKPKLFLIAGEDAYRPVELFFGLYSYGETQIRFDLELIYLDKDGMAYLRGAHKAKLSPDEIGIHDPVILDVFQSSRIFRDNHDTKFEEYADVPPQHALLGDYARYETLDVWSNRSWIENGDWQYYLGRGLLADRLSHPKGSGIFRCVDMSEANAQFKIKCGAKDIVLYKKSVLEFPSNPPYQKGDPSSLVYWSSFDILSGNLITLFWIEMQNGNMPVIKINHELNYSEVVKFYVHLDCPESMKGARISKGSSHTIRLGLDYSTSSNKVPLRYVGIMTIGGKSITLKNQVNSAPGIQEQQFVADEDHALADMLTLEFRFSLHKLEGESPPTLDELKYLSNIRVGHVRAEFTAYMPLSNSKFCIDYYQVNTGNTGNTEGAYGVRPAIERMLSLLALSPMPSVTESGEGDSTRYGMLLGKDKSEFRDKLRSLASESTTLIKFSSSWETAPEIEVQSISLLNKITDIEFIPLGCFARKDGIFSFRMESPDRSDILSGAIIHWDKDQITGKYRNTLSVLDRDGLKDYNGDWAKVFLRMEKNRNIGAVKSVECEWITDYPGALKFAYNLLRWNATPLRKAQAVCVYLALEKLESKIDIGTFVRFELPGYYQNLRDTSWIVTGRHDDLDSMETTLELLEVCDLPAEATDRFLLLESGGYILHEDEGKIRMEGYNG